MRLLTLLGLWALFTSILADSVPVLLWSNQARSFNNEARLTSSVEPIESNDLLGYYSNDHVPVVAFVQKDLSVEQFATNDAPFVSSLFDKSHINPVFFTNVKDPRRVYSLFEMNDLNSKGNIAIYLPGKNLKENDNLIKSYTEKFNATGPAIFLLSGEQNKYMKMTKKRVRRDTKEEKSSLSILHSPDKFPCVFVSVQKATVIIKDDQEKAFTFENPNIHSATCQNDSSIPNHKMAENVILTFNTTDSADTLILTLNFVINSKNENYWIIDSVHVSKFSDYGPYTGFISYSATKNSNSFSCQKTVIQLNGTEGEIWLESFQIQPFVINETGPPKTFNDSSDCSVWFTLPIWTGLIVILLLITILYFGVIALMSISTPDRFENPKGRGLIITNFDE